MMAGVLRIYNKNKEEGRYEGNAGAPAQRVWQETLLLGWFGSGVLLWQFKAVGPRVSNTALTVHDLLTWIGLPYIIYHSLTRTKWLKEPARRSIKPEARPVGGGAQGHFRVYTVTDIPSFSNENWSFTIDGLVNNKFKWSWEDFLKLKRKVQVSNFHCVTGWSVYNNTWEGIPLRELLQKAGVKPNAKTVKFYSGDGVYTDTLTLDQANMDDCMVAVMHDGKPIPSDLGGPVRLIVPKMYAYKSVKWLNRIELIEGEHVGYWEQRGYSNDAWVGMS
ncbi:molybdopterin-dependent oxidoreductase [Paenibacillus sp. MB22_1]|uniref:molybdopterin-dependent oxidoreductase n=1 Tax=Paenibacillus sp. MB22_1 TaxID=3383121 RepID=UPI0039A0F1EF